jgi:hypothetical protein
MSALRSMDGLLKLSDVTTVIAYHRLFDFDVLLFRVFLLSLFLKHSRTSSIDRDEMIATDFIWPLANLAISTTGMQTQSLLLVFPFPAVLYKARCM